MMDTVDAAAALIKSKCDKPFVYVKKKPEVPTSWQNFNNSHKSYTPGYAKGYEEDEYYGSLFDSPAEYKDEHLANIALNDNELELEVTIYGPSLSEQNLLAVGETKAECWMTLFLENPNLCFNDIVDYSWN